MGRFSRSAQTCLAHTLTAALTKGPGLQQGASVNTKIAQSVPGASLRLQKSESTREGLCGHCAKTKFLKSLAEATIHSQKAAEDVAIAMIKKIKIKKPVSADHWPLLRPGRQMPFSGTRGGSDNSDRRVTFAGHICHKPVCS